MDLYMELPHGVVAAKATKKTVIQLIANIYDQKQFGRVWNQYLVSKLEFIGFTQSHIDKDDIIFIVCVHNGIFLGTQTSNFHMSSKSLWHICLQIENQGHLADYMGVNIKQHQHGLYKFHHKLSLIVSSAMWDLPLPFFKAYTSKAYAPTRGIPGIVSVLRRLELQIHHRQGK
ncbi:hypothetical protein ACHAW6_001979 [Cyclotella cf. meneghiniana]